MRFIAFSFFYTQVPPLLVEDCQLGGHGLYSLKQHGKNITLIREKDYISPNKKILLFNPAGGGVHQGQLQKILVPEERG